MILQQSPNNWSCIPTSFAMLFRVKVQKIFDILGHDGSEILWRGAPEPLCRRSFHVQEMIDVGIKLGYFTTVIEAQPLLTIGGRTKAIETPYTIPDYMAWFPGVIMGIINQNRHAVAYDGYNIYDPNGTIYKYVKSDWKIEMYCPVIEF